VYGNHRCPALAKLRLPWRVDFLQRVIQVSFDAREAGDHPFGALLVVGEEVVCEARNLVATNVDITAHAEIELVRALEKLGQLDLLARGTVYASCEPCPMCVGALFWAGARHVVFGLSAARLKEVGSPPGAQPFGFAITASEIGRLASPQMTFDGPNRQEEAAAAHHGFWWPNPSV
jgi:tRNA(Arg) A34 adenosine deaminase TadA